MAIELCPRRRRFATIEALGADVRAESEKTCTLRPMQRSNIAECAGAGVDISEAGEPRHERACALAALGEIGGERD